MGKLVLTGIGMATPIGTGSKEFWRSVEQGHSGIRKLTKFSFPQEIYCGEIVDLDIDDHIQDKRFRRAAPISQFALVAAALALGESGGPIITGSDIALVMGVTHGALGYTQSFHKALIEEGMDAVSPIHFSDSVLNAPAGNTSICFGIRGPVHTLIGGPETIIKSMMMACRMLDAGTAKRVVVVSAEELNGLSMFCKASLGMAVISEGAGAVVIEKEEALTGPSPYCFIGGMAAECNPSNPDAALGNAINQCLETAGLRSVDVDLVMTDEKTPVGPLLQGVPAGSIIPLTGNAFAVSVLWDIVLSAMALKKATIPQTVIRMGASAPGQVNNVMVCAQDRSGSAAAILLSNGG